MSTQCAARRVAKKGLPNWRIVRYADDFVILVHGTETTREAVRETVAACSRPMGLRLSEAKTSVRPHRRRVRLPRLPHPVETQSRNEQVVRLHLHRRPAGQGVEGQVRALTHRTSLADLGATLTRLNQILRGWAAYFRHAVATHTFKHLRQFLWWRIVRWLRPGTVGGGPPSAGI